MTTDSETEKKFNEWWEEFKEASQPLNGARFFYADNKEYAREGFKAGVESVDVCGKFERVPCDCHLFKEQVCDFCQGVKLYFVKTIKDNEGIV